MAMTLPVRTMQIGKRIIRLVFAEMLNRKGQVVLSLALLCTDLKFPPLDVLRAYKLRWKIEICYRECKQNHGFEQFHARTFEVIYGQLFMSLLAYICLTLTRLLTAHLKDRSLGWIKKHYFNSLVILTILDTGEIVLELSPHLFDTFGLPDFYP